MSVPSLGPLVAAAGEGKVAAAPSGKAVWLRCVWLADAQNPADMAAFPLAESLSASPSVTGEVRSFAGGVDVAFTRPGRRTPVKVGLPHCTRSQVAWLETHLGRTVCLRDDRGRKVFAIYFAVPTTENRHNTEASVDLDLTQLTFLETV